jgi:hypothetical protein
MQRTKEGMMKRIIAGLLLSGSLGALGMVDSKTNPEFGEEGVLTPLSSPEFTVKILPAGGASIEREGNAPAYCARNFVRLEPADKEGYAYAVYDLEAWFVQELPPFYLCDVLDKEHPLLHQREVLSQTENDQELRAEYLQRVFVLVGEDQHDLRKETVFTPYSFTEREEDRWDKACRFLVRDYKRGDGSIFSQDEASFPHQTRILSFRDDDGALSVRKQRETFAIVVDQHRSIKTEEVVELYPFTEREDNRAAQRLFAVVRDYKRSNGSILSKDYQTFPYQERCAQTVEDDNALVTKRTIETFVAWGTPQKVLMTEVRPTPYTFTEREDNRAAQRTVVLVRDYRRGNGSTFARDIQTFPYRERCAQTVEDDNALVTRRTFEFYVDRNPHIARDTQVRPTPYTFTEREDNRAAQRTVVLVRDYRRGNGSTFARDIQTFPYRERCTRTVDDDSRLLTERTFEFYVDRNPHIVRDTQVRPTPYPYADRSETREEWKPRYHYMRNWNIRTYTRSNGSTFSSEWKTSESVRDRGGWVEFKEETGCNVQ